MLFVADFTHRRTAFDMHATDFTGAQTNLSVGTFTRHQLNSSTRGTRHLRAFAGNHLYAVNGCTDRNVADRQCVTGLDRCLGTRHDFLADNHPFGSDDVTALAIGVAKKSDVGGAVRIILKTLYLGRNAVLVALEVDQTIMLLVPTTLVTGRDTAVVVPAGVLRLAFDQTGERLALVQICVDDLDNGTTAGGGRLYFDECHLHSPPFSKIDFLTRLQANECLLPVLATAHGTAETLLLALDGSHLHGLNLHLEQQFNSSLDFRLGRVGNDAEDHLFILLGNPGRLF